MRLNEEIIDLIKECDENLRTYPTLGGQEKSLDLILEQGPQLGASPNIDLETGEKKNSGECSILPTRFVSEWVRQSANTSFTSTA